MKVSKTVSKRAGLVGAALGLAMMAPIAATAQDVTLTPNNGQLFEVKGKLVSFDGEVYTVDSPTVGMVKVRAGEVTCSGDACPFSLTQPTQAESGPIVWDVSLWGSRRAFTEHVEKLSELVEEATGGDLQLNISYGGLAPSRENLDGIAAGTFEMAQFCAGYHPEKNPSLTVLELPFLGVESMEQEKAVSRAVYEHPAVIADLARWNATLLMPTPQPQYNIAGVGTPPTNLASFGNMTVRATGGAGRAIEALGASTISIPAPQVKDALSSGTVNAVAFAPHAHMAFETINNALWWTNNLNPGTANCPIVVNTDALNALPSSSRVALMSSVDQALDHFIANYESTTMAAWKETLAERGVIEIAINDEILNAIDAEVAGPTAAAWLRDAAGLGLPAEELLNLVYDTLEATR